MESKSELQRLNSNTYTVETYKGLKVEIVARADKNAQIVLDRIKEVLRRIISSEPLSADSMPIWLLEKLSKPLQDSEAKKILQTPDGFDILSNYWTLEGFLYWFRPENRSWYWWYGEVKDDSTFKIYLEVAGDPFAWGALKFLLEAAGSQEVVSNA